MMPNNTKLRTVRYCEFELRRRSRILDDVSVLFRTLDKLKDADDRDKAMAIEERQQTVTVESVEIHDGYYWVVFGSAKYGYTTDYMNTEGERKKSNKGIDEGEVMPTHMCLKIDDKDLFATVESNTNGVSISSITNFLEHHLQSMGDGYTLSSRQMAGLDMAKQILNSNRIMDLTLTMDCRDLKLGEFEQFYITPKTHKCSLKLTSDKKSPFNKSVIARLFDRSIVEKKYERARVSIRTEDNREMVLDSLHETMNEHVDVRLNDRGLVDSQDIFMKLQECLKRYLEESG